MQRAATALLLAFLVSACAGTKARRYTLIPAMQVAWPKIEALALLASNEQDEALVVAFGEALRSGSLDRIVSTPFEPVRMLALQGVQLRVIEGTLGNFGAGSYRENIKLFNLSWVALTETR